MKATLNIVLLLAALSLPSLTMAVGWYVAHPVCVGSTASADGKVSV